MDVVNIKVNEMRRRALLTQKELAEKANISRSYLANIESGKYNPSLKVLKRIADALGVNVVFLIQEDKTCKKT